MVEAPGASDTLPKVNRPVVVVVAEMDCDDPFTMILPVRPTGNCTDWATLTVVRLLFTVVPLRVNKAPASTVAGALMVVATSIWASMRTIRLA